MNEVLLKNLIIATQITAETLPISSSSHVWLVETMFRTLSRQSIPSESLATEVLMDLLFIPTLIVLAFFFRKKITRYLRTLIICLRSSKSIRWSTKQFLMILLKTVGLACVSTVATINVYFSCKFLGAHINAYSEHLTVALTIGLFITMLELTSTYFAPKAPIYYQPLVFWRAALLGAAQGVSVLPGISRLGTTLVVGRWLGLAPNRSLEYSILLQIIIFCANIAKNGFLSWHEYQSIVGNLSSTNIISACCAGVVSYAGLQLTDKLNRSHKLWLLSPYFIIPITMIWYFLQK